MQAIRQFQEERASWEAEREELLARCRQEEEACKQAQERALLLEQEVTELRSSKQFHGHLEVTGTTALSSSTVTMGRDVSFAELKRTHALKQLTLMETIDALRRELQEEQLKSDARKAELDQTKGDSCSDSAAAARQAAAAAALYEAKVRKLEDENLVLRSELNAEKHKVVELKKAAQSRVAKWKTEMQTITAELEQKEQLEEDLARLRIQFDKLAVRESKSRSELGTLAAASSISSAMSPQHTPTMVEDHQKKWLY